MPIRTLIALLSLSMGLDFSSTTEIRCFRCLDLHMKSLVYDISDATSATLFPNGEAPCSHAKTFSCAGDCVFTNITQYINGKVHTSGGFFGCAKDMIRNYDPGADNTDMPLNITESRQFTFSESVTLQHQRCSATLCNDPKNFLHERAKKVAFIHEVEKNDGSSSPRHEVNNTPPSSAAVHVMNILTTILMSTFLIVYG